MKYIEHKELGFILFPSNINHDSMANWLGGKDKVSSAGVVCASIEALATRGGSMTLGLPENKADAHTIRNLLENA